MAVCTYVTAADRRALLPPPVLAADSRDFFIFFTECELDDRAKKREKKKTGQA
jgi:hypothetical protein